MKRKWRKRKWRTSDGKHRLSIGENYLEKVKMSGENLSLSGTGTIQRRHLVCLRNRIMYIDQLQDHYGGGHCKILVMMQDKTRKVLVKYFSKIGREGAKLILIFRNVSWVFMEVVCFVD